MSNDNRVQFLKDKTESTPIPDSLLPENIKGMLTDKRSGRFHMPFNRLLPVACFAICFIFILTIGSVYVYRTNSNSIKSAASYREIRRRLIENEKGTLIENVWDSIGEVFENEKYTNDYTDDSTGDFMSGASESNNGGGLKDQTEGSGVNQSTGNESKDGESPNHDFSETNVQVKGVDEADIVKTDGEYIYGATGTDYDPTIVIVEAKDGGLTTVSRIRLSESWMDAVQAREEVGTSNDGEEEYGGLQMLEFYLSDNVLIAICINNSYDYESFTIIQVYDLSDKTHPKLVNVLTQDGAYSTSRKTGHYLYTFSMHQVYDIPSKEGSSIREEDYVPCENGKPMSYNDIYLPSETNNNSYLVITAMDINDPGKFTSSKSILSASENFYVSKDNVYAASVYQARGGRATSKTQIIRMGYKDGEFEKPVSGMVDGTIHNQFSMDEHEGYLRVVSTLNHSSNFKGDRMTSNALYVLNEQMNVVGNIEDLAPNESVYSARFMGDVGYFVTFRQMDPLFSVDLSDPKNPKILDKLKIPGFSEYLHFYGKDLLLGIGQEVDPNTGEFLGLKLSMFDISDPTNVTEVDKLALEDYVTSPALYNHKSVMVDVDKNLFGFCAVGYASWGDEEVEVTKYFLYSYEDGFVENASINLERMIKRENYYEGREGVRGFYIGDYFYLYVKDYGVVSYSLKTYEKASQYRFP